MLCSDPFVLLTVQLFMENANAAWTMWTPCTRTCGGGKRERRCLSGPGPFCYAFGGVQEIPCNPAKCPGWSNWLNWSACTELKYCAVGSQTRTRNCPGVRYCPGLNYESRPCGTACSASSFTHWSAWSACSMSCKGGSRRRMRTCQVGQKCHSQGYNEEQPCNVGPCAQWTQWNFWTVCSRTCNRGQRRRFRICQFGTVESCPGNNQEDQFCNTQVCGGWAGWTAWSACSKGCGAGGQQTRIRSCMGVHSCPGNRNENRACFLRSCAVGAPKLSAKAGSTILNGIMNFVESLNPTNRVFQWIQIILSENKDGRGSSGHRISPEMRLFTANLPGNLRHRFERLSPSDKRHNLNLACARVNCA